MTFKAWLEETRLLPTAVSEALDFGAPRCPAAGTREGPQAETVRKRRGLLRERQPLGSSPSGESARLQVMSWPQLWSDCNPGGTPVTSVELNPVQLQDHER